MARTRASFAARTALAGSVLALVSLAGCESSEKTDEPRAEDKRINEIQLQDQMERFTGVFGSRLLQAAEPLSSVDVPRQTRKVALKLVLAYTSSALDIATGRFPEANLLDMLAFLSLCRGVLDDYWIPQVFGEVARPISDAFAQSQTDLERLALTLLSRAQVDEIQKLVIAWRKDNPGQHRVELVRMFSVAETTGRLASEREREASGILSSLTAATQSADQALLLGERVLYLSQRMPFLLRLQARVGAQEVADEILVVLNQTDATLKQANELAARSGQALTDTRAIVDVVKPLFEPGDGREPLRLERLLARTEHVVDDSHKLLGELDGVERTLASAERTTDKSGALLTEVRQLLPAKDADQLVALLRSELLFGAGLGALLVAVFWIGYVAAHRLVREGDRGQRGAPPSSSRSPAAAGQAARGAS